MYWYYGRIYDSDLYCQGTYSITKTFRFFIALILRSANSALFPQNVKKAVIPMKFMKETFKDRGPENETNECLAKRLKWQPSWVQLLEEILNPRDRSRKVNNKAAEQ
jgi:hypothetical protein